METSFWENIFKTEKRAWGNEPAETAIFTSNYFKTIGIKKVLIPGVGYGRNTKPFLNAGIQLTGIEISESAIKLARADGIDFPIHHGSVLDMPFDKTTYEGIYCYSLLHLFNKHERRQIISACYNQLSDSGQMTFVVISNNSWISQTGKYISNNRMRLENGLTVFFYNEKSIEAEFTRYGLIEYPQIEEPIKYLENEPPLEYFLIRCQKRINIDLDLKFSTS